MVTVTLGVAMFTVTIVSTVPASILTCIDMNTASSVVDRSPVGDGLVILGDLTGPHELFSSQWIARE